MAKQKTPAKKPKKSKVGKGNQYKPARARDRTLKALDAIIKSIEGGSTVKAACKAARLNPVRFYFYCHQEPTLQKRYEAAVAPRIATVDTTMFDMITDETLPPRARVGAAKVFYQRHGLLSDKSVEVRVPVTLNLTLEQKLKKVQKYGLPLTPEFRRSLISSARDGDDRGGNGNGRKRTKAEIGDKHDGRT